MSMTIKYENPWRYNKKVFESTDIGEYYGFVYSIINNKKNRVPLTDKGSPLRTAVNVGSVTPDNKVSILSNAPDLLIQIPHVKPVQTIHQFQVNLFSANPLHF